LFRVEEFYLLISIISIVLIISKHLNHKKSSNHQISHKKLTNWVFFSYFNYYLIRAKLHLLLRRERCDLALKESVWNVIIRQIEIRIKRIIWSVEIEHKNHSILKQLRSKKRFRINYLKKLKEISKRCFSVMNNEMSFNLKHLRKTTSWSWNRSIISKKLKTSLNQQIQQYSIQTLHAIQSLKHRSHRACCIIILTLHTKRETWESKWALMMLNYTKLKKHQNDLKRCKMSITSEFLQIVKMQFKTLKFLHTMSQTKYMKPQKIRIFKRMYTEFLIMQIFSKTKKQINSQNQSFYQVSLLEIDLFHSSI
jgi:hypothetical protein